MEKGPGEYAHIDTASSKDRPSPVYVCASDTLVPIVWGPILPFENVCRPLDTLNGQSSACTEFIKSAAALQFGQDTSTFVKQMKACNEEIGHIQIMVCGYDYTATTNSN